MSINTKFEAYKLKRELKRSGQDYVFYRMGKNEFGEPTNEPVKVCTVRGLYHEQTSNIEVISSDSGIVRTKKIPMVLCLTDDIVKALRIGDILFIGAKKYEVTGITDIYNWEIISDISLEVVDDGFNPA